MQKTVLILQARPLTDLPPEPPTPTNEALLARICEGDGDALYMLYQRLADLVRSVIARTITQEDVAEDVLREVFEAIRDRAEHYTPEMGRALGWILTVARRRAAERAVSIQPEPKIAVVASGKVRRDQRWKKPAPAFGWDAGTAQAA